MQSNRGPRSVSSRGVDRMALLATILLGSAVSPAASQTGRFATERLDVGIPALMEAAGIPGLSIAIVVAGEVAWSGAYGVADAATGEPVTRRTVFQAASLTKQMFALTALRLAGRGVIDLDAPLAEYLPYPRLEHEPRYRRITARHALSHSTGLPNWGGPRLELQFDPGEGFNYSGEGYVYLQKTLEHLTKRDLTTLVAEEVLRPLGLEDTWMVWRPDFEGRAAARHGEWGQSQGVARPDAPNAASSLLTTASDYARFIAFLLDGGGLDTATWADARRAAVQVAARPQLDTRDRLYWGLGWGIQRGRAGPALWQWGHNDGFRAFLLAYPDRHDALVYFTNGDAGLSIADALVDLVADVAGWPPDDHWAIDWLDYEPYDDPARLARRDIVSAFRTDGPPAGLATWESLRAGRAPREAEVIGTRAGEALLSLGRADDAIAMLSRVAERFPASSLARRSIADALLAVGRYAEADAAYAEVLAKNPADRAAGRGRAWIAPVLAAQASPPTVAPARLARLAGDYGPRHVSFVEGLLVYRRDGNSPTPLTPISADTFVLEGLATFRIRFVEDGQGRVTAIMGLYADGSEDETPRDP